MPELILSDLQKQLIEENIVEIKNRIRSKVKRRNRSNTDSSTDVKTTVNEALSYVPEVVANEFNPDLCKKENFAKFIAQICYFRICDHYRKYRRTYLVNKKLRSKISKMIDAKMSGDLSITDDMIMEEMNKLRGKKVYRNLKTMVEINPLAKDIKDKFITQPTYVNSIDWKDLRESIEGKVDNIFKSSVDRPIGHINKVDTSHVYKVLLKEHLLPKCSGDNFKTLTELSDTLLISKPTLYKMLRSDQMKNIVKQCLAVE